MPVVLEFRGVHKAFGAQQVLRGFDLAVEQGEVMYIIGTSGVGKSVAIKHVVGLIRPDRGQILLDGRPLQDLSEQQLYPVRKQCGMVFQHATLFDSMTLLDNVALPLRKHRRMGRAEARAEAERLLKVVHMEPYALRYPAELGDGLRKRAAIARTLALEPRVVLFDEPTTSLDPISARRIDALISELAGQGVTSVVVSHDLASVFSTAHRVAFLYQGQVRFVGTPAQLRDSDDPVAQQFINGRSTGPMETPGF